MAVLSSALDPCFRDLKFMEPRQRQQVRQEVLQAAKEQYGLSSDEREAVLGDLQGLPPKRLKREGESLGLSGLLSQSFGVIEF